MPDSRLGRYITSQEFFDRAAEVVEDAVCELERRGFAPTYDGTGQGERVMPADKLGRYMTSPEFLMRAKAAVADAVHKLEAKGIEPVYVDRRSGRIVGGKDDEGCGKGSCEGEAVPDILNRVYPREHRNER